MAATIASRRGSKIPADLDRAETEDLLREIVESLKDARTVEDRRELVARLIARRVRRSRIIAICKKAFNTNAASVDVDIKWAKDWMLKNVRETELDQLRGECMATMDEVVVAGFAKGDLGSVVAANRHKAQLTGLVDEGIHLSATASASSREEELRVGIKRKLARLTKPSKA